MKKRGDNHTLYKQPECTCAKLPCQLLLISRAMYADAISIFYNQNKFVLRAQIPSNFAALGNLGALALANMTSLSISIRSWPCPRGGTFPFEHLPRELCLRIIGFTDIAPLNYDIPIGDQLGVEAPDLWFSDDGPSPKDCCRRCTETTKDCCCPSRRAAYSKACTCRRIPLELALVNKQFYHDVTEVLFSQNIFQFSQDPEKTVSFFRHLPSRSLRLVRRVKFQFPEDEVEC